MSFEVRNELMNLLSQNATAYKIAMEFVSDNKDKLTVFRTAYSEANANTLDSRSEIAKGVAEARWSIMFPEEVK